MLRQNKKIIVVSGPESTGKTTLSEYLAKELNATLIPEYARSYIEKLKRPYTYEDVEHIAQEQLNSLNKLYEKANEYIILDTFLIVTKIWFQWCYKSQPSWLEEAIKNARINYYLLCNYDIPWQSDSVRENGGEKRIQLFQEYLNEIKKNNVPYSIVSGDGMERNYKALNQINTFFKIR
jgi:NadR type nicotinamide-nucleotide adenylyltransferase